MSRAASRRDHKRFCDTEGWAEVRNARGKPTQHHITYELSLPDGRVLRTRISRPANAEAYGPSLWGHVLDEQVDVTEDEFWDRVDHGSLASHTNAGTEVPQSALPADLVYQLVHTLGLGAKEVEGMTRGEAVQRLTEHWSQPEYDADPEPRVLGGWKGHLWVADDFDGPLPDDLQRLFDGREG